MIVRFSFRDVIKIPEFQGLNQFDLLPCSMDERVLPYLFTMGANIDRGLRIQPCRHRDMSNKQAVGYSYVLLERTDKEWLNDPRCSMQARIQAQEDKYLASDMVRMSQQGNTEAQFIAMCVNASGKDGTTRSTKKDISEDYDQDHSEMIALRAIQLNVRGFIHVDEDLLLEEDEMETNFETETKANY